MATNEKGAGTTGMPTSVGAGVGTERLIVLNSIYSPATAEKRKAGDYVLGKGTEDGADGGVDRFRDLMGRYWTSANEGQNLTFLNKKLGKGSADSDLNIPCDLYVTKPMLVSDEYLGEYEQTIIIDPDPVWMGKVAKPVIEAYSGNTNIESTLKQIKSLMAANPDSNWQEAGGAALESEFKEAANQTAIMLLSWWKVLFDFDDKNYDMVQSFKSVIEGDVGWLGAGDEILERGTWFDDYSCRVTQPFEQNVTTVLNSGIKSSVIDLKSIYNFHINDYETALTSLGGNLKEQILPNLYTLISSYIPEDTGSKLYQTSKKFDDLIYLGSLIENTDGKPALATTVGSAFDYFTAWAIAIQNAPNLNDLSPISQAYTNLLFPSQDVDMLKYYNNYKYMFPMYNDLRFTTDVLTSFADTLRSSKLASNFMRYYVTYGDLIGDTNHIWISKKEKFMMQNTRTFLTKLVDGSIKPETKTQIGQQQIKVLEFETWLASIYPPFAENFLDSLGNIPHVDDNFFPSNAVFMTTNKNETAALAPMEAALLGFTLYGKARKIAKSFMRHYGKMCKGQTAHSETIMYKVEKYEDGIDTKLQTFYFFNSSEIEILRFIDTQVHYNTKYKYKILAVQLVVGTTYGYSVEEGDVGFVDNQGGEAGYLPGTDLSTFLTQDYQETLDHLSELDTNAPEYETMIDKVVEQFSDPQQKFDQIFGYQAPYIPGTNFKGSFFTTRIKVRTKPNLKIIEVPYAEIEGRILDKPPIFPDAYIAPYKGVNNKVLINLNNQVGEYFMKPIIFNEEEKEEIDDFRDAQKIPDENKPIQYKADDPVGFFQIFRMERRPASYKDFADNLLTTIDGKVVSELNSINASSAAYADVIKPNKKYYYTFRVVDGHGHVSNPSPIFEVEMVDDNGTVYMLQKIVTVGEEDLKGIKRGMKKYLQIKPTVSQGMFNGEKMDIGASSTAKDYGIGGKEISLGTEDESVWGKRFKIRLTSRSTGRQIDLNVNFAVEHSKASEELLTYPVDVVPKDDGLI